MKQLNQNELNQVNGGVWANVAGAVAGGVGAFFGTVMAGNATGYTLVRNTVLGAAGGAINPVRSIGQAVSTVGAAVGVGGASQMIDEITMEKTE